ncbi:MAG: hypothetical protein HY482_02255 [Candidatus Wildermuthbacteria bacterium]|nr:hypothetical protein [Candidatus Wildermuthbacteria bacterium]
MKEKAFWIFLLVAAAGAIGARLLPHPPNFAAIGALALFAGVYAPRGARWAVFAPLGAMFASDLLLGFDEVRVTLFVYGSFLLYGLLGMLAGTYKGAWGKISACLGGSLSFFVITNWAVWAFSSLYSHTASGLLLSYGMALPFFKYTLLGDMFFSAVLFGAYYLVLKLLPQKGIFKTTSVEF